MPAASSNYQINKKEDGYSLLELLVGVVIFGFSLLTISMTLFPMISSSASPHFEARAAALGQSVMSQVLAKQFDKNSDPNGSRWRCDESASAVSAMGIVAPNVIATCSSPLIAQNKFAAIEDFIGCWGEAKQACTQKYRGTLDTFLGGQAADYQGFSLNINVYYDKSFPLGTVNKNNQLFKRVDLYVDVEKHGRYQFSSYRGNF